MLVLRPRKLWLLKKGKKREKKFIFFNFGPVRSLKFTQSKFQSPLNFMKLQYYIYIFLFPKNWFHVKSVEGKQFDFLIAYGPYFFRQTQFWLGRRILRTTYLDFPYYIFAVSSKQGTEVWKIKYFSSSQILREINFWQI